MYIARQVSLFDGSALLLDGQLYATYPPSPAAGGAAQAHSTAQYRTELARRPPSSPSPRLRFRPRPSRCARCTGRLDAALVCAAPRRVEPHVEQPSRPVHLPVDSQWHITLVDSGLLFLYPKSGVGGVGGDTHKFIIEFTSKILLLQKSAFQYSHFLNMISTSSGPQGKENLGIDRENMESGGEEPRSNQSDDHEGS